MNINFETDKLIIMNYPAGAGGKFITLVLNVHPDVLPQDEKLARIKMKIGNKIPKLGFEMSMKTFKDKRQKNKHIEYGCVELAGFNAFHMKEQGIKIDEKNSNNLWRELTNQSNFYFFMCVCMDTDIDLFQRYVNKKIINLKNFNWILEGRSLSSLKNKKFSTTKEGFCFDMSTLKNETLFKTEIDRLLKFLNLKKFNLEMSNNIEILRKNFLETYKIGFKNE